MLLVLNHTFSCHIYINAVAQSVLEKSPLKLCGYDLNITPFVEEPMVKITGIRPELPQELLELFFESSKRSGGGIIKSIDIWLPVQTVIITFEDEEGTQSNRALVFVAKTVICTSDLGH